MRKHIFTGWSALLLISGFFIVSCRKETGGSINTNIKPGVGTRWVYRYTTYYSNGGQISSGNIVYKAVSQEMQGSENWLKIVDSAANTTVFYLKEKTDGLYLFSNNSANLLCKYPAALSESYSTHNGAGNVNFTVSRVNDTIPYGQLGNVVVNLYKGYMGSDLVDEIWYNPKVWIAHRNYYTKFPLSTSYYRSASLIIQEISY